MNTELFSQIIEACQIMLKSNDLSQLKINLPKLNSCLQLIPNCVILDKDDLFSKPRNHQDWLNVSKYVKFIQLDTNEQLKKSYQEIINKLLTVYAITQNYNYINDSTSKIKAEIEKAKNMFYTLVSQQIDVQAQLFIAEAKDNQFVKLWNRADEDPSKRLLSIIFQAIEFKKKIYIPRNDNYNALHDINIKQNENDAIQVRLLNHIQIQDRKESPIKDLLKNFYPEIQSEEIQQVIIHIRMICILSLNYQIQDGGGFVSMSSRSHQTYTRKWANELKVPIFSIDYRKAIKYPFPAALEDCWEVYLWIINNVSKYYLINPKKIIIVGDSAGGNLAAALTIKCIQSKVRVPDGLLLVYPALNLNINQFTPSAIIALNDYVLPHTFLKQCVNLYIPPGINNTQNPLVSPINASDEILKQFPRTRIIVGTNDCLHDESWRFTQRLSQFDRDIKMTVYNGMPHGFLNFDVPGGMKEAQQIVKDCVQILKFLLESPQYEQ